MSRLLTIGTFDTLHLGHASFLRRCERFADEVIVGVNSDAFVAKFKGAEPIFTQSERVRLIEMLGYTVHLNDGPGRGLIEEIKPDIVAIGTDWARRDYHAQIDTPIDYFEANRISLVYVPYTLGISSTELKARLR